MEDEIIFGDAFANGYRKLIELYNNDKETGIADKLKNKYTVSYKIIRIPGGATTETELGIFLGLSTDYPAKLQYKGPDGSLKEWVNNTDQTVLIFRKIQHESSSPGRAPTLASSSPKSKSRSKSRSRSRSGSRSRSASRTEAAKPRSRSRSGAAGGRSIKKRKHRKSRR